MNMDTSIATGREDRPLLKRADVEHLLQEVGSPKKLEFMRENLQGVDLSHFILSVTKLSRANLRNKDIMRCRSTTQHATEGRLQHALALQLFQMNLQTH